MRLPQLRKTARAVAVWATILLAGCTTAHYEEKADKETYGIIAQKSPQVPNMDTQFTITPVPLPGLEGLPVITEADEALGEAANSEVGASVISLEKALALAVQHNRTYQTQKETLYLAALNLTLDRHDFTPIFSASASDAYNRVPVEHDAYSPSAAFATVAPDVLRALNDLTGTASTLITSYANLADAAATVTGANRPDTDIDSEYSNRGQTKAGVDWLLKGGGRIAVDLTSNFLRYLTGNSRYAASSALVGNFTQPLLRGAGRKVAAEALTQSERDVLYALRDYTDFRKRFIVDIVTAYYGVLQSRDGAANDYQRYLAFKVSAERDRALAAEGRKKKSDLGRIEQAELNAKNSWTNSARRYQQALDNFKIQLGLAVDVGIVLDQKELDAVKTAGIQPLDISVEDATKVALYSRLDLYNARDQLEDAARHVEVIANQLKPGLDLVLTSQIDSKAGNEFETLDFDRARWSAGLDLDLNLDRKSERNRYRSTLIALERAGRELDLAVDGVKLDVRDAWRGLDKARQDYDIQVLAVRINEDRVEEQQLLAELGKGDAINLIDAQNDLTTAQKGLTDALVAHRIARLAFWRDMGILFVKENGQWQEITEPAAPTETPPDQPVSVEPAANAGA